VSTSVLAIRHARVHGAGLESLVVGARLRHQLTNLDATAGGLSRHAILCIRRLSDPLPGGLRLRSLAARPTAAWRSAMHARLQLLARSAARPAHEAVPAGAEAVLFSDEAELLACLGADAAAHRIADRWWWRALLGERAQSDSQVLAATLVEHVPDVPAAFELLASQGRLADVVRLLPEAVAAALIEAICAVFGLPLPSEDVLSAVSRPLSRRARPTPATHPSTRVPPPPWSAHVPASLTRGLQPQQACLVGITLMLRRAPEHVRRPAFWAALRAWHAASVRGASAITPEPRTALSDPLQTRALRQSAREHAPATSASIIAPPATTLREPHAPALPLTSTAQPASAPEQHPPQSDTTSTAPQHVMTSYGGAFYLINVALSLGLYADFTAPRGPNLPIAIWDFIALVARALVGPEIQTDPLWPLLADLAHRPRHHPPATWVRPRRRDTLVPRVRARLALALDQQADVGPIVCEAHAQIAITATHVDVTFSLSELPIAIRLAGLDRDPGWIPSAGRSVAFHYE
jgi:hypothetical protein